MPLPSLYHLYLFYSNPLMAFETMAKNAVIVISYEIRLITINGWHSLRPIDTSKIYIECDLEWSRIRHFPLHYPDK
jgi:hypothetical protein